MAVSVSPAYYATKHRSLVDRGSGWTIVDNLDELPERPTGTGFDRLQLAEFQHEKTELAARLYPIRPAQVSTPSSRPGGSTTVSRTYRT